MSSALSKLETSTLSQCEEIIERGQETFIEVGNAMLRIRNERLYRAEFGTFQEYCEARWHMSPRHAHRMIEAAEVAGNVTNWSQTAPSNESQIRPLARLEPARQREAWQSAVEHSNGKPTAKDVEAAAHRIDPDRIRPISPAPASSEQLEAEKDSETLWLLKSYWKKASKAERTLFRVWLENNNK